MDLFEPGPGSQLHDFNGDIARSGLFWTVRIPDSALKISSDGRRATLKLQNFPVVDSFQFFAAKEVPAKVSMTVTWRASSKTVRSYQADGNERGAHDFTGRFQDATATAQFSGSEDGFSFRTAGTASSSKTGWAEIGSERNGVYA